MSIGQTIVTRIRIGTVPVQAASELLRCYLSYTLLDIKEQKDCIYQDKFTFHPTWSIQCW